LWPSLTQLGKTSPDSNERNLLVRGVRVISVVVPAHNEAAVIETGLRALTARAAPGEIEVIVVCNGCTDRTAELARAFAPIVRVIETDVASKTIALNLGDSAAAGFPRIYVDADVVLPLEDLRRLVEAMRVQCAPAGAPTAQTIFLPGTSLWVRLFYDAWMALPYVQEGMIGAGTYALSRDGRSRFGEFPPVIADDGFVRLLFNETERIQAPDAVSRVLAPKTLADLIRVKARSRLGIHELAVKFPDLHRSAQKRKRYGAAAARLLAQPRLYPALAVYVWVTVIVRLRARAMVRNLHEYVWEKDLSSRDGSAQDALRSAD
jgi:glycosyltransferase involved in cell wall biosynthesis